MSNTIKTDMSSVVERFCESTEQNQNLCVNSALPDNTVVTMAYIPFQEDKTTYRPEKALLEGTLFPTLNKPFCGRSLCCE